MVRKRKSVKKSLKRNSGKNYFEDSLNKKEFLFVLVVVLVVSLVGNIVLYSGFLSNGEIVMSGPILNPNSPIDINILASFKDLEPQNTWIGMISPVAEDLDGDGDMELLVLTQPHDPQFNDFSTLFILDHFGRIIKKIPSENCWFDARHFPSVGDVDGDGLNELVVGSCLGNNGVKFVKIYSNQGILQNEFISNTYFADELYSSMVLYDINGDGEDELIKASEKRISPSSTIWKGVLEVTDEFGNSLQGFPVNLEDHYFQVSSPAVGDINLDGNPEIIVSYVAPLLDPRKLKVVAISSQGNILWSNEFEDKTLGDPIIANVDMDPEYEIIITSTNGIRAFNHDGSLLFEKLLGNNFIHSNPVVADIDLDGDLEIVFGYRFSIYALDGNGNILLQKSIPWTMFPPLIANLDNDPQLEILYNSVDDNLLGEILAYNLDGSNVRGFPKRMGEEVAYTAPLLSDIDGDGIMELISSTTWLPETSDGNIYKWDLKQAPSNRYWQTYQYNNRHTGFYGCLTNRDCSLGETCVNGFCE
ncbi:MAG: VCBS repeat-containing protein [archaeon]